MRARAKTLAAIRSFFSERGYLEVDTPQLAPALIPESMIATFSTTFSSPYHDARELFLVPSPEIWMKRLLAAGSGDLFQISHCFRNAEQVGRIHNPEFTMLEWYTLGADYFDSADRIDELLASLSEEASRGLLPPCRRMSMAAAFDEIAGIDLTACMEIDLLKEAVARAGLTMPEPAQWEELFNALFLQLVEPELPQDRPLILFNYPSNIATLAKQIPGTPWSERWELYIDGIEIANCFTEETDPIRVAEYYRHEEGRLGAAALHADGSFPAIFAEGFPACSGTALGVDRLLMALLGIQDIR
ncbi:MAG TPA: amino acid--tRNA ligase-related protein, partial [Spirochaetia bacterium]|nr:amino acid--tRNA ligase-related protein [Spirochaetia bacterium]